MNDPYYCSCERPKLRERELYKMIIADPYNSHNRDETLRERVMNIINEYLKHNGGLGRKNYNINKLRFFKDIPDGIEILIDYVDVTAIRTMNIPSEIIYESIYRKLPELFEE